MKKIIITGGAGYIGNSVVRALPSSVEVVLIDNFHIDTEHKRLANAELASRPNVTLIDANVADVHAYAEAVHGADTLIYMASLNSYKEANRDPMLYLRENAVNMQVFLDALKVHAPTIQKAVLTSTRGVYGEGAYDCAQCSHRVYPNLAENLVCPMCGSSALTAQPLIETDLPNPSSHYGVTKKIQEDLLRMYAQEKGIELDIFRIFNVYGEDQGKYYSNIGILPQMFEQIKTKNEIYMSGNGEVARDFVAIDDIVELLLKSVARQNTRLNPVEIYHVGSGEQTTISDLADCFEQLGYEFEKKKNELFGDIHASVANNEKVKKAFAKEHFASIRSFVLVSYTKNI